MSQNDERPIMPGDRVVAFDYGLYRDDVTSPLSVTMRPATVVARCGRRVYLPVSDLTYEYSDLCDLQFDHRPDTVSKGHFTTGLKWTKE